MANGGDGQILTFPVVTVEYRPDELAPIKLPSPAAQILAKAAELIDGERDKQHGDRKKCLQQIAAEWNAMVPAWDFAPVDVALMMAKVKIARIMVGEHNPDNYIDACGYLAIAGELASDVPRP